MSHAPFSSSFAYGIYASKYRKPGEQWVDTSRRVAGGVMGALHYASGARNGVVGCDVILAATERINERLNAREFIPGGRYLYATGNEFHQTQNCLLLRCADTREGWADLSWQAEMALLTGAGIGVYYGDLRPSGSPVQRTGGVASGPVPKMIAVNELGRAAVQGGDRRCAIWAGLLWSHPDIDQFIRAKDWPQWLRDAKEKDPNVPAPADMTNISVCLDDEFFAAYADPNHPKHALALRVYWKVIDKMTTTGEPGFSVDLGKHGNEKLRNAPVAGDTHVLTSAGYRSVRELVGVPTTVWTGVRWADDVVFKKTQSSAPILSVEMTGGRIIRCEPTHEFLVECYAGAGQARRLASVERIAAHDLEVGDQVQVSYPQTPESFARDAASYTLGWVYGDGSFTKSGGADLTLCSDESKACLPYLEGHSSVNASDGRGYTRLYFRVGTRWQGRTKAAFPTELFAASDDVLASFIAGLFDADGNFEPTQNRLRLSSKHEGFLRDVARGLEQLGIMAHVSKAGHSTYGGVQTYQLVIAASYSKAFANKIPTVRMRADLSEYAAYRSSAVKVIGVTYDGFDDVYCADVQHPEHSFMAEGVLVSNCTEIVSEDDSDVCNLGGLVLSRFDSPEAFGEAVRDGVLFLTAGTLYSDVPYDKVAEVREKNRRLGLDIMGVHEFLLQRGLAYGTDDAFEALEPYMREYDRALEYARAWQERLGLSLSVAATAGSPTGTRGPVAETTTSWEPVPADAYKRAIRHSGPKGGERITYEYVVDPVVQRLMDSGVVVPQEVEDAHSLAYDVERRFRMQQYAQSHTDQALAMTINIPGAFTAQEQKQFGELLIKYLPDFRGLTVYPDGARAGQPIQPCSIEEALAHQGVVFESAEVECASGACGI